MQCEQPLDLQPKLLLAVVSLEKTGIAGRQGKEPLS